MSDLVKDKELTRIFIRHTVIVSLLLSLAIVLASLLLGNLRTTLSIASGTIVSVAGFYVLALSILWSNSGKRLWLMILGLFKMGVIGVVLWFLITRMMIDPLFFIAGFSTTVLVLVIQGMIGVRPLQ